MAEGAALYVQSLLSDNQKHMHCNGSISRVWVFAQSDRAQRDCFLGKLREWHDGNDDEQLHLGWPMDHNPDCGTELCLFYFDETMVEYN